MADLRFVSKASDAIQKADVVAFLAPESRLKAGWIRKAVSAPWTRLLDRAASSTAAGAGGRCVRTENPDGKEGREPARLVLGVLPDKVSRHNAPSRCKFVTSLLKQGELREERVAILICLEDDEHALPIACAVAQAFPLFDRSTSKKNELRVRVAAVRPDGGAARFGALETAAAERARWAASLVDTPPQDMNTPDFVAAARKAARGVPHLRASVWSGKELLERGLGGHHAVGRAAVHPPKMLVLRYAPPKAKRRIALVGKGIVYDTGGLSIKPTTGMYGMKFDMAGAAGCVAATLALASTGFRDEIVCLAALAENAIGPDAYRPDDILAMHSGKTVEINNTDAEGRLLLADGVSYAARKHKPDLIVDMATLTGAQLVATGLLHAAVVSNRAGLEAAAVRAGRESGDLVHPLPFAPEIFQAEFKSEVADMRNSVADRMNAQSSCAAQFVYSHIQDLDVPWLHVDIAGPSGKGRATGYGVALLARLLPALTAKDLEA